MSNGFSNESMLDVYIYETTQNLEQLEQTILSSEKTNAFSPESVNEIFRIMHTIKGSSAMMTFNDISSLAHAMEDMFFYIREEKPKNMDCALLSDLVLDGVDFIKLELEKIKNSHTPDGNPKALIESIKHMLSELKGESKEIKKTEKVAAKSPALSASDNLDSELPGYDVTVFFEEGCEMENIRAFSIIHNLEEVLTENFTYWPEDILEDTSSVDEIRKNGFKISLYTDKELNQIEKFFSSTMFLREIKITPHETMDYSKESDDKKQAASKGEHQSVQKSIISVDVTKLDTLMDLMGEMVIAEAMVTQNPELYGLKLDSFYKAARQLEKITGEMQDIIMSMRMIPLTNTFQKMHRVVRDMSRKLEKDVELELIGENTEVDKNIIERISDPLMHLVRNAVDHGIEYADTRLKAGKPKTGRVTLEAKNAGSDVLVMVKDDGRGLNKEKIIKKAKAQGLLSKPVEEMTDREIYNLIFLPGFSTNDNVTEFSGRGVGMDVVVKNLEAVGGSVYVESEEGKGTVIIMKIPLTLAIIDGMNIRVGNSKYTIPTTTILETFRPLAKDYIIDPEGNEMMMVRGECYPIVRIHKIFGVKTEVTKITDGIMLMVEIDGKIICIFADELIGQYQIVVKALPSYMKNIKKIDALSGCTLLGDGSISLILNVGSLANM